MLKLRIPMLSLLDPLGMAMAQRKFVSHYYSVGGGGGSDGGIVVVVGRSAHSKGNVSDEEAEEVQNLYSFVQVWNLAMASKTYMFIVLEMLVADFAS